MAPMNKKMMNQKKSKTGGAAAIEHGISGRHTAHRHTERNIWKKIYSLMAIFSNINTLRYFVYSLARVSFLFRGGEAKGPTSWHAF